jgi:hypothetical protein
LRQAAAFVVSTLFTALIGDLFGRAQTGTLVGALFAMVARWPAWGR